MNAPSDGRRLAEGEASMIMRVAQPTRQMAAQPEANRPFGIVIGCSLSSWNAIMRIVEILLAPLTLYAYGLRVQE